MKPKGWHNTSFRAETLSRINRIKKEMVKCGCTKSIDKISYDEAVSWALDKLNNCDIHV